MLADPRSKRAGGQLRRAVAVRPQPAERRARTQEFPNFDDNLRQAFRRETELFFESIIRRGSQRPRPADRRLHVRQRAAGAALRHPERLRQPLPPRHADGSNRRGLLGQGSILTVTSYPNRTSPVLARQVDSGERSRHAAAAAAAERAGARGEWPGQARLARSGSVWRQHRARSRLRQLPPRHGSARLRARELRRHRRLADERSRRDRSTPSGQLADGTPVNGPVALREAL